MADSQKPMEMPDMSSKDKQAVLLQVERLLASSHFRNSRRYPDLLRYVVRETMEGRANGLKERTLGIAVFGREAGFDTAGDSIVRVAAAEVRKRIAQYYHEEGHEREFRIDLPSGSYVPRFRRPPEPALEVTAERAIAAPSETSPTAATFEKKTGASTRLKLTIAASAILLAVIAAVAGIKYQNWRNERMDLFAAIWNSPHDAVLCIGSPILGITQPGISDQAAALALGQPTVNNTVIPFADAVTLSRIQTLLNDRHKPNRVQLARFTTFSDLRSGPVILVGAFDNPWTLRLTAKMRFRFIGSDGTQGNIVDSKSNAGSNWAVDFHVPYSDRTQDYAIVAITHDDTLDQPMVVVAGIGPNGTMAAGEFLVNSDGLKALSRKAPAGWNGRNLEVVLATQVIQGSSGPPKVVAAEYW